MSKIILKCGKELYQLSKDDIIFLEADGRYTYIHIKDKTIIVCENLGNYEKILPSPPFLRTHNKYIVNITHFVLLKENFIVLGNGKEIPVSIRRKKKIYEILTKESSKIIPNP